MSYRRLLRAACATFALPLALLAGATGAQERTYPSRPVRLIVPFAAGGPADTLARTLVQPLGERLGQAIVIENRPGAGGRIGADAEAKAAPDGYTLLLATSSTHSIGPAMTPQLLPYDAVADFTPIASVATSPGVLLVPSASPARTLREFIEYARRQPGRLSYASSGTGTIVHLATEYFKVEAGLFIVHIPYRGTALAMSDLIGGTVDLLFDSLVTGLPHARNGEVRALAVTSLHRTSLAPELPAVAEVLPGFEAVTWFGLYGPRGLSADLTARLNQVVNEVLADADLKARFAHLGAEPTPGTPADFAERVRADTAKWRRIVRERNIGTE